MMSSNIWKTNTGVCKWCGEEFDVILDDVDILGLAGRAGGLWS